MDEWDLNASFGADLFAPSIPANARQVDMNELLGNEKENNNVD